MDSSQKLLISNMIPVRINFWYIYTIKVKYLDIHVTLTK